MSIKARTLAELIEETVSLGRESATGFRAIKCEVCHDHSERAGFKFDNGVIGHNCFNCQARFVYEEGSGKLGREARRILEAYGITREQLNEVTGSAFFNKSTEPKEITLETIKPQVRLHTPEIELPPRSHLLGSNVAEAPQEPLIEYLLKRCIDPLKIQAYFSLDPKFLNRVIIPCFRDGKIIFWQARTIIDGEKPRFRAPGVHKDAVLWGYDNLWKNMDQPLFCTEGIFDAAPLDGVALLGSTLNESKLEVLNRCRRRKIVVVDRDENGGLLAEVALQHGWEITFPPTGVSDVNASVQKFGLLFTTWTLLKNTTVPTGMRTASGLVLQSELDLKMQLALTKLGRK